MITLYTTHCPLCTALEKTLKEKGVKYEVCTDKELMISKGFTSVPMLEIDWQIYNYKQAIQYFKQGDKNE